MWSMHMCLQVCMHVYGHACRGQRLATDLFLSTLNPVFLRLDPSLDVEELNY